MANFQFGQDNVGSNWQVPSWYVQGMSQSPMAASIAGLGNSISAFTSGYQAAKQAERGYGLEQRKVKTAEDDTAARRSYYESLMGKGQQSSDEDKMIGNWLSNLQGETARYNEWKRSGSPAPSQGASMQPNVLQNEPFPQSGLTPATQRTNLGAPYANPYYDLPSLQGQYLVNPNSLMGY